ncbi:PstS family phosphate ABC transporter substrate-binding protein [Streptomyces sp. NPDC021020]|uniref:PstS family phosphate ABC transporter substrate-binding protein n=1 Tax=Streptomyces sp. NPDC021020 TaxID=3365109 RepID=UPI0037B67BA8
MGGMDGFLSADNIVAVATALIGVGVSVGVVWYERRVRGKSIGYRVQMDIAVDGGNELFTALPRTPDATLVLLRIENDGAEDIRTGDYTDPDPDRGLTVLFTGRQVQSAAVTQPDPAGLIGHFRLAPDATGVRHDADKVYLPRVPLNPGEHYKLLIRLTGGPVNSPVTITGGIAGGKVKPNRSVPMDEKPPSFPRPARFVTVLLTVCVTVLAAIIVVAENPPPPMDCATGHLTVTGSTAFAPTVRAVAAEYTGECPDASVTVTANGSEEGVRQLSADGDDGGAPDVIAMSDGPKAEGDYPALRDNQVAVMSFSVVVNSGLPVRNLSTADIQRIFLAHVTDWDQFGGGNQEIRLVSRTANSGTRDIFSHKLLGNYGEPALTSHDCRTTNGPTDHFVRCERDTTGDVLSAVASVPGAIGYAETSAALAAPGVRTVTIDGAAATAEPSGYPFTEIEHAYTYGTPGDDSLATSFLNFLLRGGGPSLIAARGHVPCYSPDGYVRCGLAPAGSATS